MTRPLVRVALAWAWPLLAAALVLADGARLLAAPAAGLRPALESLERLAAAGAPLRLTLSARVDTPGVPLEWVELDVHGGFDASRPEVYVVRIDWRGGLPGGEASGRGRLEVEGDSIRLEHRLEAPFALETAGRVRLGGAAPVLELAGEWHEAAWPLTGSARFTSEWGRYRVEGALGALALELEGALAGEDLPPAELVLEGVAGGHGLDLETLAIDLLGGRIEADGRLQWSPGLTFRLALEGRDLDPQTMAPGWPGQIALAARLAGSLEEDGARLRLDIERLEGALRGQPLTAEGAIALDGETLEAERLAIASGVNRLELDGRYGERSRLRVLIDAPDLAGLAPGLAGSLAGEGRASGPRAALELELGARGRDLRFAGLAAKALDVEARAGLAASAPLDLELTGEGVALGGAEIGRLAVEASGERRAHTIGLVAESAVVTVRAELEGGLREAAAWAGRVHALEAESGAAGTWRLAAPARLEIGAGSVALDELCLTSGEARACAEARRTAERLEASLSAQAVPLALANPLLPERLRLEGELDARARVARGASGLEGEALIEARPGHVVLAPRSEARLRVPYREAHVELRAEGKGAHASFAARIAESGHIEGNARIGPPNPASGARPLAGRVQGSLRELALLEGFVPVLARPQGRLEVAAELGGDTDAPTLRGHARLHDLAARVPDLGIELEAGRIEARAGAGERVAFDGSVASGPGRLALEGELAIAPGEGWPAAVTLSGEEVEVARLPAAHVFASPDLRIEGNLERLHLDGRIVIPRADITPVEGARGAVRVSADEVIVGASEDDDPDAGRSRLALPSRSMSLEVVLGEEVYYEGFGASGRLAGRLRLTQSEGQIPLAQGELEILDGRYRAYGQALEIEHGRLIFAGPLDNPGLDIRAVREARGVKAGVAIGGTLKSLESRVFSEPPLPDAEALSYLLTGGPLSGASQADAGALLQAALSLGLERSQGVTQQLKSTLGVDELTVASPAGVDQSALVVGKRLSADLYVRYALGLFDTVGSLLLNYRLTDSLSIEAQSGERQGAELIYRIERDTLLPGGQSAKEEAP